MKAAVKIGDTITCELISSIDPYTGTVTAIRPIKTRDYEGMEIDINIPGYGVVTILDGGGAITDDRIKARQERSGIPERFAGVRWDAFKWSYYGERMRIKREFDKARAFIINNDLFRDSNKGLYIFGKASGCGKTMLASILANEIMYSYGVSVKFIDQVHYLDLVRSDEDAEKEKARSIQSCTILFLDGFGSCSTPWQREIMLKLIESRCKTGFSTCYISAYPPDRVKLDDTGKVNDILNATTLGVMLPDVPVRAKLAAEQTKEFEQMVLNFEGSGA